MVGAFGGFGMRGPMARCGDSGKGVGGFCGGAFLHFLSSRLRLKDSILRFIDNQIVQCALETSWVSHQVYRFEAHLMALDEHYFVDSTTDLGMQKHSLGRQTGQIVRQLLRSEIGIELINVSTFKNVVAIF
jgi:hypothetical protein